MAYTIHSITPPSGSPITKTDCKARQFVSYFRDLYNLPNSASPLSPQDRAKLIDDFLTKYGPSPTPSEDLAHLGAPITVEEALAALKHLKMGKSLGQDGLSTGYYRAFASTLIPKFVDALK